MILRELELTNFRSYTQYRFNLSAEVTIVAGPNASGKTNLLEALYVLGLVRSFRAKDEDLITHGQTFYRLSARHDDGQISLAFETTSQSSHKQVKHNQVNKPQATHLGTLPVVLFEPGHVAMVDGPPAVRRRYLDTILAQTDAAYVKQLHAYQRALRQRNRLLESRTAGVVDQLFAWDLVLADAATQIVAARQRLTDYIQARIGALYEEVAGQAATIGLDYESAVSGDDYISGFLAKLEQNRSRDLAAGFTTIGPHRDNLAISFKDAQIGSVASRGEMRTVVTVLKLAELEYIADTLNRRPLLLLDDVFSELDARRRLALVGRLTGLQTVVTTTDADAVLPEMPGHVTVINTGETARA